MAFYDKNAPTEVVTDASPIGLGAILVQEQLGVKRAVAFASRSLSEGERRYSQTEKEALAVVWGYERFSLYLLGLESFQLFTDCKALEVFYGPKSKSLARVERWVLRLGPFKYTVRHVSSGQNIAECISPLAKVPTSSKCNNISEECVRMLAITLFAVHLEKIKYAIIWTKSQTIMRKYVHLLQSEFNCTKCTLYKDICIIVNIQLSFKTFINVLRHSNSSKQLSFSF